MILILEEGRVTAIGTHSELLRNHPYYQAFYKGQLKEQRPEVQSL